MSIDPVCWRDAIPVLPYQFRWIRDDSQLKIAVWSRQSGKSFAAALRAVLKCLEKRTQYIILSKGERQSRLFMEKVKDFCRVFKELRMLPEYAAAEETDDKTMEVLLPAQPLAHHRLACQSRYGARLHRPHRAGRVRLPRRRPQNLCRLFSYYHARLFNRSYLHTQRHGGEVLRDCESGGIGRRGAGARCPVPERGARIGSDAREKPLPTPGHLTPDT